MENLVTSSDLGERINEDLSYIYHITISILLPLLSMVSVRIVPLGIWRYMRFAETDDGSCSNSSALTNLTYYQALFWKKSGT